MNTSSKNEQLTSTFLNLFKTKNSKDQYYKEFQFTFTYFQL